jgi:hypothetical protein
VTILLRPERYPPAARIALESMSPLATQIANHWMRTRPMRARALIDSGEYLAALMQETVRVQEAWDPTLSTEGAFSLSTLPPPPEPTRR